MVAGGRRAKALKILQVIDEAGGFEGKRNRPRLLDIGTGNGEIAHYLGAEFDVVSVDVTDQRQVADGFNFVRIEGEQLPFADRFFDVVVSNHVIEHVSDADRHLAEIARVVQQDGLVYLATPNRLWPWEVHYRVPLLHYLPSSCFMALLKHLGRYHEDVCLLSWWVLKNRTKSRFSLTVFGDRICKWPNRYHMSCHPKVAMLLSWIPLWFYRIFAFMHPTLIVVLRPRL